MAFPGSHFTQVGNLTADPELRFTPSGAAVCNFTVAYTPRRFDRDTSEYIDLDAIFLNCSVWRQAAENVAESLTRGMRVVVTGDLRARSWETPEGDKRTVWELDVAAVGPDLSYATAVVTKNQRSGSGDRPPAAAGDNPWDSQGGGERRGRSGPQGGGPGGGGQRDPWATGDQGAQTDEPPF